VLLFLPLNHASESFVHYTLVAGLSWNRRRFYGQSGKFCQLEMPDLLWKTQKINELAGLADGISIAPLKAFPERQSQ
jgi:hypothetical protein